MKEAITYVFEKSMDLCRILLPLPQNLQNYFLYSNYEPNILQETNYFFVIDFISKFKTIKRISFTNFCKKNFNVMYTFIQLGNNISFSNIVFY